MSYLGRIFIVINFVLSIAYMILAGVLLAQKWEYKQWFLEAEYQHQNEKDNLEDELKQQKAKVTHLVNTLKERTASAIEFNIKYEKQQKENGNLRRQQNRQLETLGKLRDDLKDLSDRLKGKDARISDLEAARDQAKEEGLRAKEEKEAAEDQQQELEIQLSNLQGELSEKEKIIQKQQKELWEAKQIIRSIKDAGVNIPAIVTKERPVDGTITAVSKGGLPLVMISVGKDKGVAKGYQFTVYRGNKYVGKVIVEHVYKDAAAARILRDMTVRKIQQGDRVTTKIGGSRGSF